MSSPASSGAPTTSGSATGDATNNNNNNNNNNNKESPRPTFAPPPPGYLNPRAPTFTYGYSPNATRGNSQQLPPPPSTPPVMMQNQMSSPMPPPHQPTAMGYSAVVNNTLRPAMVQPPVPQQSVRPVPFSPGASLPPFHSPIPSPFSVPQRASSNATNFSLTGNSQLLEFRMQNVNGRVSQDVNALSSSGSSSGQYLASPATSTSPGPNISQAAISPGAAMTSGVTGPPSAVNVPVTPIPSNQAMIPQGYPPYPIMRSVGPLPQAPWVQTPQMGGLRPPFLPHPPNYPGAFGLAPTGVSIPAAPLSDALPPGVSPIGNPGRGIPSFMTTPGIQTSHSSPGHVEVAPPGTDGNKRVSTAGITIDPLQAEQSDAWSAHKSNDGVVYYYNAVTGESTYEKPPSFKGEPGKAASQPTPVASEKVTGTDWVLVTTNDGKKYYYNSKTEVSSWQVPTELAEFRKKQESDDLKETSVSVPNSDALHIKESVTTSLTAPTLHTGGRDAIALRNSGAPGTSSALDMVKKKLQESGAQVTSFPSPASSGLPLSESNGSKAVETTAKDLQSDGGLGQDKPKDGQGDANVSDLSSDSEEEDVGPTKEELNIQFKEMLKERGVAPFSKWDKELPKIVFDPRFKAIPSYEERRSLFDHYVRTRADEERKEKRAAQKAAVEGFKQLLEEAKEDIDHNTDYHTFRKTWGHDPRFEALDRKEREALLNERVLPLRRAVKERAQAERAAAASDFKSMLREKGDITTSSRWSRVKDAIRDDPRYRAVKHEDREVFFNEYISELKAVADEAERAAKAKSVEQEKLKERERELRKRKEREELEMERVKLKVRRKEAVSSYQALLVETIKDPQASWTESKPRLVKDPQQRASNSDLDESDLEKLFREHVKMLYERCANEFRALLMEVITPVAEDDGKTVLNSWSTAKRLIRADPRYAKMPRKDREVLWKKHAEEIQRKQKVALEQNADEHGESKSRGSGSKSAHQR